MASKPVDPTTWSEPENQQIPELVPVHLCVRGAVQALGVGPAPIN